MSFWHVTLHGPGCRPHSHLNIHCPQGNRQQTCPSLPLCIARLKASHLCDATEVVTNPRGQSPEHIPSTSIVFPTRASRTTVDGGTSQHPSSYTTDYSTVEKAWPSMAASSLHDRAATHTCSGPHVPHTCFATAPADAACLHVCSQSSSYMQKSRTDEPPTVETELPTTMKPPPTRSYTKSLIA